MAENIMKVRTTYSSNFKPDKTLKIGRFRRVLIV